MSMQYANLLRLGRIRLCPTITLFSTVATLAIMMLVVYLAMIPRVSAVKFRAQVEIDLPLGTDRVTVESWLSNRGLPCDPLLVNGRIIGFCGSIRHIYRIEVLSDTELYYEFYFDDD